ncbi:MAG: alanyl-tRNA editing protein [Candidatus Aenigmarchaeota archaeon]|nr:alanyl-tRNA editing protein [Candidatus Aenigmarchaeota archaeon]
MKGALYLSDSYIREWEAMVEAAEGRIILLDSTAFYPAGGGQPADKGIMKNPDGRVFSVLSVSKRDGRIYHEVDSDGLKAGESVSCELDWERRYRLMRMHTATHILCAVIHKHTRALITGNQLDVERTRVDFNLDDFDKNKVQGYADEANKIIAQGKDVRIYFMKRGEALSIPSVVKLANSLPPQIEELRIVEIPGIDLQADGGTQVRNTSEIGRIRIEAMENKGKNNRRIYFTLEQAL